MQLAGKTAWLALNQAAAKQTTADALTGARVQFPRGNYARFNCALFSGAKASAASFVDDVANIVSATLTMRKSSPTGSLLAQQTIAAADFASTALTYAEWTARTGCHFSFLLEGGETNWALAGWDGSIYWVVAVATADEPEITVASGLASVYEDGTGEAGETVASDPTYMTAAQVQAYLDGQILLPGGTVLSGGLFYDE